jgi:glycosyltransferase involved in cell wall biosynthesis
VNVLMMTNTYLPHVGGVARSVDSCATWLRSRGQRVLIGAPRFAGAPRREPEVVRIPAIQHFNGSDFSVPLPITRALHRAVERFAPDLVHSHHPFLLGDTALRIAAERDLPIVFTHHTLYEHYAHYVPLDSPAMQRFAIELGTSYANLCDLVFAPSESVAALLHERGVRARVEVIPTGVDPAPFAAADGAAFRSERGIPARAVVVGHVGRLAPEKNLEFLARAVARCAEVEPRAHALIVGDGPEADRIRAIFAERGLGERVHLTGVLQGRALAAAYRAMDVFAFASKTETQGLVLAEATTAGVPVVALDAPGAREVVRDRVNGRLLSSETVPDFLAALGWVLEERETLRAGALRTARELSIDATGERALAFYRELAERAPASERAARDVRAWRRLRRRLREEWKLAAHRARSVARSLESARTEP